MEIEKSYTDTTTGHRKWEVRTIAEHVVQPAVKPQPAITSEELLAMVDSLRQEMQTAQDTFDNKDQIDAQRNGQKSALASQISELTAKLEAANLELHRLEKLGSARQEFIAKVKSFESKVVATATGLWNHLANKLSTEKYDAPFKELTSGLKEVVVFAVNRTGIKGLTLPTFTRLHRLTEDQISNALLDATMERVYNATVKVEEILTPEEN
jgi:hypothetical protein